MEISWADRVKNEEVHIIWSQGGKERLTYNKMKEG
jgi:hypothetical protein